MGYYQGRVGSIIYNGKTIAKVKDWSITTNLALLETTTLGDSARTYHPSTKEATGSANILYYRLVGSEPATQYDVTTLLGKLIKTGSITTADKVLLKLSLSPASNDTLEFPAYLTSIQLTCTTGELSTAAIQFTVDGDFTQAMFTS